MTYPSIPDMSNYTPNFTLEQAVNWRDNLGVKKVYIQAIDPPPGYPPTQTRAQIEVSIQAGLKFGIYFYHWYENGNWLENDIALISGYEEQVDDYMQDIEDVLTGVGWSARQRADSIDAAQARIAQLPCLSGKVRKYTGKWYVDQYISGIDYSGDDFVVSQYDGVKDASVITRWEGLGTVVAKQFVGTSTFGGAFRPRHSTRQLTATEVRDIYNPNAYGKNLLARRQWAKGHFVYGMVSGIDLSVPSDEEYNRLMTDDPNPNTDPCADVQNTANGLIQSLGWLGKDAMEQTGVMKSSSKYVKAYLDQVRAQCDAHGIQHA
jgi:hypothetical protein